MDVTMHEAGIMPRSQAQEAEKVAMNTAIVSIESPTLTRPLTHAAHQAKPLTLPFASSHPLVADGTLTNADLEDVSDSDTDSSLDFERSQQQVMVARAVIIPAPRSRLLPYSTSQSGLIFDWRMREHTEPTLENPDDIHPEDPRRISEIYDELLGAGLINDPLKPVKDPRQAELLLWQLDFEPALPADLLLVHSAKHIKWVKTLVKKSDEQLAELGQSLDSLYIHRATWMCARLAAGGAIEACKSVVNGRVRNAVAVIRPPGHHAEHDTPGGFCFFDNVAIAAKVCQRDYPSMCRKVMIIDWDVHHGNGVQQAFYNDPNVLYVSVHVHQNGKFYPMGPYGNHLHCGEGAGLGKNINIPWARTGMRDSDYLYAFQKIVMPIGREFNPDLVIVSAGFDAAEGDTLGGCHVSPAGYAHMTHMLMSLADGKVAVCLEGGYNLRSIARSSLAVTKTLMGEPPERIYEEGPSISALQTIDLVARQQSRFWRCINPKELPAFTQLGSERLHDVIRAWQSKVLFEQHRMAPIFILRQKISKSFENQVLATPNYHEARPLLLIFHDPPDVHGVPDPQTGKVDLHNTILTDVTKKYIDWAVGNGFAVIDVNIPKHVTDPQDPIDYVVDESHETRADLTRSLASYLWENYIEVNDATPIFMMGIGSAHSGILDLLSINATAVEKTRHVFAFVADTSLQGIRRSPDNEDSNQKWYYRHSSIFIAKSHDAFNSGIKLRKRFGKLLPSPHIELGTMMAAHMDEITGKLFEMTADFREARAEQAREQQKLQLLAPAQPLKPGPGHRSAALSPSSPPPPAIETTSPSRRRDGTPGREPPIGYFSSSPMRHRSPAIRENGGGPTRR